MSLTTPPATVPLHPQPAFAMPSPLMAAQVCPASGEQFAQASATTPLIATLIGFGHDVQSAGQAAGGATVVVVVIGSTVVVVVVGSTVVVVVGTAVVVLVVVGPSVVVVVVMHLYRARSTYGGVPEQSPVAQ